MPGGGAERHHHGRRRAERAGGHGSGAGASGGGRRILQGHTADGGPRKAPGGVRCTQRLRKGVDAFWPALPYQPVFIRHGSKDIRHRQRTRCPKPSHPRNRGHWCLMESHQHLPANAQGQAGASAGGPSRYSAIRHSGCGAPAPDAEQRGIVVMSRPAAAAGRRITTGWWARRENSVGRSLFGGVSVQARWAFGRCVPSLASNSGAGLSPPQSLF